MRYLTFSPPGSTSKRIGALSQDGFVIELSNIKPHMSMLDFIGSGRRLWQETEQVLQSNGEKNQPKRWIKDAVSIAPALSNPPALRDFYAFEQHVATSNANRGREIPETWYDIPVFYFSNPNAIYGHEQEVPIPKSTQEMDFELEVAAIIGKAGKDIPVDKAVQYIFGFTIFNDWSARDVQRQEMSVGLGPAKGKDFASSLGPYIITPDELEDKGDGRPGVYDLEMIARINGHECSRGNWKDIHYSFGEMIARASADVMLSPGDVIGSGTVGTGTLLEITKAQGPWLQKGDVVELEIERLGVLRNRVG